MHKFIQQNTLLMPMPIKYSPSVPTQFFMTFTTRYFATKLSLDQCTNIWLRLATDE